jgi:hypothetical protein
MRINGDGFMSEKSATTLHDYLHGVETTHWLRCTCIYYSIFQTLIQGKVFWESFFSYHDAMFQVLHPMIPVLRHQCLLFFLHHEGCTDGTGIQVSVIAAHGIDKTN